MKKIYRVSFAGLIFSFSLFVSCACGQEGKELADLSKQITEAKTDEGLLDYFEQIKELYFQDNKFPEFAGFLDSLSQKKKGLGVFIDYYTALCRYTQLKYLEESQNWNEYFSNVNAYRQQITESAEKAASAAPAGSPLSVYARLLIWRFHADQQDGFNEAALSDLLGAVSQYAKASPDIKPIKDVADQFFAYGEKGKSRELYRIYVDKLLASQIKEEELAAIALGFYKEANLELSAVIYDAYIGRLASGAPKERLLAALTEIAGLFAWKESGFKDPAYAETIFQKIEEYGTKAAFNQGLMYLRAFNLEKIKEYGRARDIYVDLLSAYPQSAFADEATYKVGIIYTYALRDIQNGRSYFDRLSKEEGPGSHAVKSLYHLGLLSQWGQDFASARDYYDRLIQKAGDDFQESVKLCRRRLKELEESLPMEHNLKTFLDVSFKEEFSVYDATKIDLRASSYEPKKDAAVNISASVFAVETGCMQPQLEYLWSGDLGAAEPASEQSAFDTAYKDSGTKEINLVVVSPSGVVDRNLDMVDVRQ